MKTNFAYNLKQIREMKKFPKTQLAKSLTTILEKAITPKDITAWEDGFLSPSPDIYPILADFLEIDLKDLFKEPEKKDEPLPDLDKCEYKGKTKLGKRTPDLYIGYKPISKEEYDFNIKCFAQSLLEPIREFYKDPKNVEAFEEFKKTGGIKNNKEQEIVEEIINIIKQTKNKTIKLKDNVLYYDLNNSEFSKPLNFDEEEIWKAIRYKEQFKFNNLKEEGSEIVLIDEK